MPKFLVQRQVTTIHVFEVWRQTPEEAIAAVECGPIEAVGNKESVELVECYDDDLSVTLIGKAKEQ